MTTFLTLAIFVLTLVLMLWRPRGIHEAWAALLGGVLMLVCGLETPQEALHTIQSGYDVLIFLFALMLLSALLDQSGFFQWTALHAVRMANGDGKLLYRNVFLLGAFITAFLSLDTTAVILTPIVLAFVMRLGLNARPFLIACAFVSNTASLLLPVSNLTNLLFVGAFNIPFVGFTARMILPQVVAIVVNYLLFKWLFREELPSSFSMKEVPVPSSVIHDKVFFGGALVILGLIFIGYFIGSLSAIPPYQIALGGCFLLLLLSIIRGDFDLKRINKEISWSLFPFVMGLFVVVRGVENLGLAQYAAKGLEFAGTSSFAQILVAAVGAALGSNIVNNIPMGLLSISVLTEAHSTAATLYGALLGCNIGPNLTVAGSLATMLVISSARKKGSTIGAWDFFKVGIIAMPAILLSAVVALWVTY